MYRKKPCEKSAVLIHRIFKRPGYHSPARSMKREQQSSADKLRVNSSVMKNRASEVHPGGKMIVFLKWIFRKEKTGNP
jgi:hypothetical protein